MKLLNCKLNIQINATVYLNSIKRHHRIRVRAVYSYVYKKMFNDSNQFLARPQQVHVNNSNHKFARNATREHFLFEKRTFRSPHKISIFSADVFGARELNSLGHCSTLEVESQGQDTKLLRVYISDKKLSALSRRSLV